MTVQLDHIIVAARDKEISAAFLAGTPKGDAAGPERKVTMPIFTGAASCARTAIGAKASAAAAAAASFLRSRMMSPRYCLGVFAAMAPEPGRCHLFFRE